MLFKAPAGRPRTADEVANVAELLMSEKGAFQGIQDLPVRNTEVIAKMISEITGGDLGVRKIRFYWKDDKSICYS